MVITRQPGQPTREAPNRRKELCMNEYLEELIEQRAQQWDDEVEDAEEM